MTVNEVKSILSQNTCLMSTEITKNANVHYHAIIDFKTSLSRIAMINKLRRKRCLGYFKITPNPITFGDNLKRSI